MSPQVIDWFIKYQYISKNLMKSIVRNENEDLSTKEVSIEEKKLWVSILTQTHGANL